MIDLILLGHELINAIITFELKDAKNNLLIFSINSASLKFQIKLKCLDIHLFPKWHRCYMDTYCNQASIGRKLDKVLMSQAWFMSEKFSALLSLIADQLSGTNSGKRES